MRWPKWLSRFVESEPDELSEEIRAHLEERAEDFVARGMSKADAMAAAKRAFGNVSLVTDRSRDVWRWKWLEAARMDVLYALRLIRRYPGFSLNVILISAAGIAACTATFSLISGVLLAPLPFAKADRVYTVQVESTDGRESAAFPVDAYLQIAAGSPVFDGIGAGEPTRAAVKWGGEPTELLALKVTPSFLRVFDTPVRLGRSFVDGDAESGTSVVLLSDALWRSRFQADSGVVGTTLVLDSVARTVIGVMPPRFRAHFRKEPDVWLPLQVSASSGGRNSVNAHLRLRDGVTAEGAERWLTSSLHLRMQAVNQRDSVDARPTLVPIREAIYGEVSRPLRLLLGAVLLVLLLVSANVATMFVARASAREHELLVRRALGASNGRQLRQLLTEALVLVAAGGLLGILASTSIVRAVRELGADLLPRLDSVSLDYRVLLFAAIATLSTALIGGLPPALLTRRNLQGPGSGVRVSGSRTSSMLVIAQISLSMMLLVGSGLLLKSFVRIMPSAPGFATENRTVVSVSLRGLTRFGTADSNVSRRFVEQVSNEMRAVRGVRAVAVMSFIPFSGFVGSGTVRLIGQPNPEKPFTAFQNVVTPNLLAVLEIPVTLGRGFTERDVAGAEPVVLINEAAARRWWPNETPIGKQISVTWGRDERSVTVIGVMANARLFGQDTRMRPEVHLPIGQVNSVFTTFVVQSDVSAPTLLRDLKRAIWRVAPDLPVGDAGDLASLVAGSVSRPRFFTWAMGMFAIVAVTLSAAAVYGLLTLDVVQRRHEIGVRMALGATGARVGALVLKRAIWLAVVGVFIGTVSARAVSHYMQSLLVEVSVNDASVFTSTAALALALACLAACAPAYRAVRVDPAQSLRGEA